MITIIHGEDTQASRNYYYSEKSKFKNTIVLDGVLLKIEDIAQALSGNGLFSEEKYIFIDGLLSKRKPGNELKELIEYLNQHNNSAQVYLWESKELTPNQLKQLSNVTTLSAGRQVKQFKLPPSIFLFLDSIKPKNGKMLIKLFHKTLESKDEQFIFFMLVRHIRILLALSDKTSNTTIDEAKRLAPWQKTKLLKQAGLFSLEILKDFYHSLYEIDVAQKTGSLACPISQTIDFLLLEL